MLNIRVHNRDTKGEYTFVCTLPKLRFEIYSILVKKNVKQNGFMSYLGLYNHHTR